MGHPGFGAGSIAWKTNNGKIKDDSRFPSGMTNQERTAKKIGQR